MSISVSNLTPTADLAATAPLNATAYSYSNGTNNDGVGAYLQGANGVSLTVDGVSVAVGMIVLVMGETALKNNGLYVCTQIAATGIPCILTRHVNMNTYTQFTNSLVAVGSSGTANKNTLWVFQNVSGFSVGASGATGYVQFSSLGVIGMNKNVQPLPLTVGSGSNTVAWDTSKGLNAYVQLSASNSGNNILTISNLPTAGSNIGVYGTLVVQQPATESTPPAVLVLPSGNTNRVVGGGSGAVLLSTIANYYDIITFYYDGLSSPTFWWTYAPNFN